MFEIKEDGEVVKAELKNKRITENDSPKTGDIGVVGLSSAAILALGGLFVINRKNRKDEE